MEIDSYLPGPEDTPQGPFVRVYWQVVTPESAECGDYESGGFDQDISCTPDQWDKEDGLGPVKLAAKAILEFGFVEPSGSPKWYPGLWYSTTEPEHDRAYFEQGEEKTYSFHLKGFTLEQEMLIHREIYQEQKRIPWQ